MMSPPMRFVLGGSSLMNVQETGDIEDGIPSWRRSKLLGYRRSVCVLTEVSTLTNTYCITHRYSGLSTTNL